MILRQARVDEFDAVMAIIEDGRAALKAQGLDQWQGGNPRPERIKQDLEAGYTYVAVDDNEALLGTIAYIETGEPDYANVLEGSWLGDESYVVLHRIAVAKHATRRGVASFMINEACKMAVEQGFGSLRADTHKGNIPMQHTFKKCGMTHCCTIAITNPLEPTQIRIGFERVF